MARQAQVDLEREKKELEDSFQRLSEQAQRKVSGRRGMWRMREVDLGHLTDRKTFRLLHSSSVG